ncbi:MAG: hypothetical protein MUD11_03655 [Rhodobacteraceae bacterium]|nr:hypothetical protein [Paracoccaceae bacterium]
MTETSETKPLHIVAFVLAMPGGPLLVTALTFWMAYIPVYAVLIGGLPYLVIGTPMALLMALWGPVTVERALQWSGLTILCLTAATALVVLAIGGGEGLGLVLIVGLVSAIFGMGWAAASGWLYGAMTNEKTV